MEQLVNFNARADSLSIEVLISKNVNFFTFKVLSPAFSSTVSIFILYLVSDVNTCSQCDPGRAAFACPC